MQQVWEAPGPGPWEAEGAHFPRPIPHFAREAFRRAFKVGFAASTARYGLLLSHFEAEFVNGFWYQQPAAFGAPKGAKGPPPKAVLWLLTRLHPALRARIRETERAFAEKRWRDDLRLWDDQDKPGALARHRELLAFDVASADDAALLRHLAECEEHAERMVTLHHRYTITCTLPIGDLLAHVQDWTGEEPGKILSVLRGTTPLSRGILASELSDLLSALQADAEARALLDGADPAAVIAALSARPGPVGEAATAFFGAVRHRALNYDLGTRAAGEQPDTLIATVRAALAGSSGSEGDGQRGAIALRAKVPAQHHAQFDELVTEARTINRLRDERGIFTDGFAVGIARRAILEAGRRLAERGRIEAADHAVDLELHEVEALLGGASTPSSSDVAARVRWRLNTTVADIPPTLGGAPSPPPDPAILPPAARRAGRAVDAVLSNLFKESGREHSAKVVRGISVNDGVYEGTARLIDDASQFDRLRQGDVLVTRATAPYFNVVLPLLGAIVTDRGGQLCHAAIVAREFGIPAVVGTKDATRLIPDGSRVRVDGTTGEVSLLG